MLELAGEGTRAGLASLTCCYAGSAGKYRRFGIILSPWHTPMSDHPHLDLCIRRSNLLEDSIKVSALLFPGLRPPVEFSLKRGQPLNHSFS